MTPKQAQVLAESFTKLENRLYELGSLVYGKLFEISPESRLLFKGDIEQQKLKLARVFGEFIRVKSRSQHFLPVTQKGGEAIIPGVGALGERHEANYGVACRHYGYMKEALLYAISTLLGRECTPEIAEAWAAAFDMLSEAMIKHAGENPEAVAFARMFHGRSRSGPLPAAPAEAADSYFDSAKDLARFVNGFRT